MKSHELTKIQELKWFLIVLGMLTLFLGLNLHLWALMKEKELVILLTHASMLYVVGALILIGPPIIDYMEAPAREDRQFAELLIVLEVYLFLSGLLFFWNPEIVSLKVAVRVLATFAVTGFLKNVAGHLREFRLWWLFSPYHLLKYHFDVLRGKYSSPAYALSLGVDWLGVGYVFLKSPFGACAFAIGALFLFISSYRGYVITRSGIAFAWVMLNSAYLFFGGVFVILRLQG